MSHNNVHRLSVNRMLANKKVPWQIVVRLCHPLPFANHWSNAKRAYTSEKNGFGRIRSLRAHHLIAVSEVLAKRLLPSSADQTVRRSRMCSRAQPAGIALQPKLLDCRYFGSEARRTRRPTRRQQPTMDRGFGSFKVKTQSR
jgi:hypothetical protein